MAGNDVPMSLSPTEGLPRWLRARPFLLASTLRWLNIHRRYRFLLPACIVLLIAAGGALTLSGVGHFLEVLAQYPFAPFTSLAAACAIAAAHRRERIHRSVTDSWLAPLAAPASVFVRFLLPPLLQLLFLLLAIAVALSAEVLSWSGAVTLWSTVGAAFAAGSLVGWLSRRGKGAAVPNFHYVIIRKPREHWAQAPRLAPLSYWAVGYARVVAKPRVAANALLLVLLGIPLGTGGEKALAIAAGAWVVLHVVALFIGSFRVAFTAARWLAPTTIRYPRLAVALGYRVLLALLWVCSYVVFLTYAAAVPRALTLGLPLAASLLVASCAVTLAASWIAMRSVGMRS